MNEHTNLEVRFELGEVVVAERKGGRRVAVAGLRKAKMVRYLQAQAIGINIDTRQSMLVNKTRFTCASSVAQSILVRHRWHVLIPSSLQRAASVPATPCGWLNLRELK